ncbi:MAG TPA: pyridoxal-phosphate dependent enzyme [Solirubrobacteraceae bacterium]|nr:pyridoxal-phosphate dependent enzyme [Solirubrobacteraceae bacterium]
MSESAQRLIDDIDLDRSRAAVAAHALHTPTIQAEELSPLVGGPLALKCESLQRTGSFKLRGALAKVAALGPRASAGLVTASAGNHGRAVAQAALLHGLSCEVFMPREAPVFKVEAVQRLGARVTLVGESVDEALALAAERAAGSGPGGADGPALVHPFDDLDVIAGQATVGLELLADAPEVARVVVPVGGGGLASGIGAALRRAGADVELIGVQASACAPFARLLDDGAAAREPIASSGATIADGIAIKRPGRLTEPLLAELLDAVVTVEEDEIAAAIVMLAERAKLVAEGAGAVSLAALLSGRLPPRAGLTVAVVSGGNLDSGLLAAVLRRRETEEGRRVRLFTRVADRPGALAELLALVADAGANLLALEHVREAISLHVRETGVALTLETRGPEHTSDLLERLGRAGYELGRQDPRTTPEAL